MENQIPLVDVSPENLQTSHICCAISKNADAQLCANAKKDWMRGVFADGYHFTRLDTQGKVFVETIPAENAWCPIVAKNWLFIDCFWVSGKFKGTGQASRLLAVAKERALAEGNVGLCALSSDKKRPFLSDPGFFKHAGFVETDTAEPFYRLMALPFEESALLPKFTDSVHNPSAPGEGIAIYYSHHCPHPVKYLPLLEAVAKKCGVSFTAVRYTEKQQAQNGPNPFTTWAMYYNGRFVGNEIFSESKLEKFLQNGDGSH